ncbi:AimR family lysis-lysogeny pheromone receptor [Bacillus sp. FSL W7-1360]
MAIEYAGLFGGDTLRRITKETEERLKQMNLWGNGKEWTPALMRQLAREEVNAFSFEQVAYSTKKMAKPRMIELMNEYTLSLHSLPHVKDSFEYAAVFQQRDILHQLIERYQDDERLTEWIDVHRLVLLVLEDQFTYEEIIDEARNLDVNVKEPVLKTRLKILVTNAYAKLGKFEKMFLLLQGLVDELSEFEAGYTKSVLASRALLLVGNYYLYGKGDVDNAEKNYLAVTVNESTPEAVKVAPNHGLGLIMMCKGDRKQCSYYFGEAMRIAKETGQHLYKECLEREYYPAARNTLGETFDLLGVVPEEIAHQHIVRGDCENALELIKELESLGRESPHLMWYKGKATKNKEFLRSAMEQFENGRGVFLAHIIRKELGGDV